MGGEKTSDLFREAELLEHVNVSMEINDDFNSVVPLVEDFENIKKHLGHARKAIRLSAKSDR